MNYHDELLPLDEQLQKGADRVCNLILFSDMQWIDIQIEANHLRDVCLDEAPDKIDLFDSVYSSRFERLWEQWRAKTEPEFRLF